MSIWRSAGWPCRDAIELDLLAAGWVALWRDSGGHETLRVTDAGIRLLAQARQRRSRALGAHDRLAERVSARLVSEGRIVWRELQMRAKVDIAAQDSESGELDMGLPAAIDDQNCMEPSGVGRGSWRSARPDVFSVRNTSVEGYLHPMVHEVKVSRADLLCDLRNSAKRESYQWLSCETYYVFPAEVAKPEEIPEAFGVWVLNGSLDSGTLEPLRPARHAVCQLPFAVWMALAKATPVRVDAEALQGELGQSQIAAEA